MKVQDAMNAMFAKIDRLIAEWMSNWSSSAIRISFGTFMPLVLLPEVTFQNGNFLTPSLEGQYIIKNVMIISAAFALGGKYHKVDGLTS